MVGFYGEAPVEGGMHEWRVVINNKGGRMRQGE